MDNKKFIIIFVILLLIMVGIATYAAINTAKKSKEGKIVNITIEDFNNKILESENFQTTRVNDITLDNISQLIDIDKSNIRKLYGKKAILNTDATMYLLIEPKEDNFTEVYTKIEEFCIEYEKDWSTYLESEYDIVVDRKFGKIDKYIYLIISEDSYDIMKDIKMQE